MSTTDYIKVLFAGVVLAIMLHAGITATRAQTLPDGFSIVDASGPLDGDATAFAVLPDERILVAHQYSGTVQLIVNGALREDPVFTVSNLRTSNEQGLLGIAVDPAFPDSNYVYLFTSLDQSVNRVARYEVEGDLQDSTSDNLTIDEGSRRTLVEFPDFRFNHNGGTLRFGNDQTLYISHGDDADSDEAQDLTNHLGAILRINRDGSAPADNPTFDPEPAGRPAELFAIGLRNPFRFSIDPLTQKLFIGDVGPQDVEELNIGSGGENFGWPSFLGEDAYRPEIPLATSEVTFPIHSYRHVNGMRSVIALLTYRALDYPNDASFPPEYDGVHFFADFYAGPVRLARSSDDENWEVIEFAQGISRPVDAARASDGGMYILEYGRRISKIVYTGTNVGIQDDPSIPTGGLWLTQNYPNPFDRKTIFTYGLSQSSYTSVSIYNLLGERVAILQTGLRHPGNHTVEWDGRTESGLRVTPGAYLYEVNVGAWKTSRMMVVR